MKSQSVKTAYDILYKGKGYEYSSFNPVMRRVRQTRGRTVRSPMDYGACVLIDKRYSTNDIRRGFPENETQEIIDVKIENVRGTLEKFFKSINR